MADETPEPNSDDIPEGTADDMLDGTADIEPATGFFTAMGDLGWPGSLLLIVCMAAVAAVLVFGIRSIGDTRVRLAQAGSSLKPIRWSLIAFAAIGAGVVLLSLFGLPETDRSEVVLLYLGILSGYAASIKEIELAKVESDELQQSVSILEGKLTETKRQLSEATQKHAEAEERLKTLVPPEQEGSTKDG